MSHLTIQWFWHHNIELFPSAEILFLPVKVYQRFHGTKEILRWKTWCFVCIPTVPHVSPPQFLLLSVSEDFNTNGHFVSGSCCCQATKKYGTKMCLKSFDFDSFSSGMSLKLGCGLKLHIPILREMFENVWGLFYPTIFFCFEKA